mmetsp:Transcript_1809/g.3412  ORF Transcript_1809/g.3412 Transcript_1809/m.3412 type:complete len:501 (+) Transcript_1809:53-1555(+)
MKVYVIALLASLAVFVHGNEFEVNSEGEAVVDSGQHAAMNAVITNGYIHDISLYYVDNYDDEHFMSVIMPGEQFNMKTFVGHSFSAKEGDKVLSTFSMVYGVSQIDISPPGERVVSPGASIAKHRHPNIIDIPGRRTTATAVIFRSLSTRPMQMWYDNGTPTGSFSGDFSAGGQSTTNAYLGHKFFFTDKNNVSNRVAHVEITEDRVLYVIRDDEEHTVPQELIQRTENELQFMKEYKERTGIHWRHHYGKDGPRPPPTLYMWPTDAIGQIHRVESVNGHWDCLGEDCQDKTPLNFELEVVSLAPKVFYISDFLNDFEADHIISLARDKIAVSMVGDAATGYTSDTRTSRNSWISRTKNKVIDSLYRRAADVLNVDEGILANNRNAEEIQVVHYENNQRYEAHHDWGASMNHPNSRIYTLLMYLTDQEVPSNGGETSFPKGGTGAGFKVKPKKGDAVLFYNLLEDGNGDDLALHAALPVTSGEKWLANFWVWDPIKTVHD